MNHPNSLRAVNSDRNTGRRWTVSVFGDLTHTGSWPTQHRMSPVAVFGDIEVLVPDGVQVDVGGFTVFGSKKVAVGDAATNGSTAVIRVRGFSLFGSIKVRNS